MTPRAPFDPGSRHLPPDLPIFPLQGVLLLPRGRLPLNIFEPRYLAMTEDALRADRLIGMIQPSGPGEPPPVYAIGCAGRIVSFDETEDGRYHLTLCGISRFTVLQEFQTPRGYRRAQVDWSGFKDDFDEDSCPHFDRAGFITLLQAYFGRQGLSANWDAIAETPDERLLTSLAMICPFDACEKQALLEAPDLDARADIMRKLLEMAASDDPDGGKVRH